MSWLDDLVRTYDACADNLELQKVHKIAPPFHVTRLAHIEVTISDKGKFKRAQAIDPHDTVIPATERSSTARTSKPEPHPLCDYVKYCAGDAFFTNAAPQAPNKYFDTYVELLKSWCNSDYSQPSAVSVFNYVSKRRLLRDLISASVLDFDDFGGLKTKYGKNETKPLVFKGTQDKPLNAMIRWIVEMPDKTGGEVWKNQSLQSSWAAYCESIANPREAICFNSGKRSKIASKHPAGVCGDNAKLISNKKEKESDFVYLGRFISVADAVGISTEASFKAHSCLEWLVKRQGYRNGDLVFVAWSPKGVKIPNPFADTPGLWPVGESESESGNAFALAHEAIGYDVGQHFANQLKTAMAGFKADLKPTDRIVVMGLDKATSGRRSITFYRKILGSEFLTRIETWHSTFAWPQCYSFKKKFIGAPSPNDIAEIAFGTSLDSTKPGLTVDEKTKKATVQRLIPSILENTPIPFSLVFRSVDRVSRRMGLHNQDWEKALGIACALFKGFSRSQNKEYAMSLEVDNNSRDYLYGRLLAVADSIECYALKLRKEQKRDTAAKRYTQRFSERPFSTWPVIYNHLLPYMAQLRSSSKDKVVGFLVRREKILDEVMCEFSNTDFNSDKKLSGEFLLGYHCQRQELWNKPDEGDEPEDEK